MIRKRILTILQVLFFLALGISLVWWMAKGISEEGWKEIRNAVDNANYLLLIPVFVTLFISHYLRGLRWKLLIEPLGYKPSTANVVSMVMIGYMSNLAIPRFGEILKCTLLARYEKIPPDKLVGTIVAERAVDVVSLVVVLMITILLQINVVGNYTLELIKEIAKAKTGNGTDWLRLSLVLTGIVILLFLIYLFLKKFKQGILLQKIIKLYKGVMSGLMSIRYVKQKRLFFFYSVAIWSLYMISIWIGFSALNETSGLGIKEAFSVLSFGSIGMLVPTQGGLGPYQYAVQKTLVLYGIHEPLGYAFGWVLWLAQMGIVLVFGLLCFLLLPVINRKRNESKPIH